MILVLMLSMLLVGCGEQAGNGTAGEGAGSADTKASTEAAESAAAEKDTPSEDTSDEDAVPEETGEDAMTSADIDLYMTGNYSDKALQAEWDRASSAVLTFTDTGVSVENDKDGAVTAEGTNVTITKNGTFVLEGSCESAQITVRETEDKNVQLVMNGAKLSNDSACVIYAESCKNLFLTLAEGTDNLIADWRDALEEDAAAETDTGEEVEGESETEDIDESEEGNDVTLLSAAVYSKADLVINGTGTLSVKGGYNDGISSRDDLKVVSGNITVAASDDALVGRDRLCIRDGILDISSLGDGLKSSYDKDLSKGYIIIDGGEIHIEAGKKGIRSNSAIVFNGGKIAMNVGKEGIESLNVALNDGEIELTSVDDGVNITDHSGSSEPAGMGGGFRDGSFPDGAGAPPEGFTPPEGGAAGNPPEGFTPPDGADGSAPREGFTPPEGFQRGNGGGRAGAAGEEGSAEGQSENGTGGRRGPGNGGGHGGGGSFAVCDGCLYIRGGKLFVDAGGDGLDSNGNIEISGGYTYSSGSVDGMNAALDFNGTCTITGGVLLLSGNGGMAEEPEEGASQGFASARLPENLTAGTEVSVQDAEGKELYSFSLKKDANYLAVSAPEVTADAGICFAAGGEKYEAGVR